jgi:hypothetical protein
LSQPIDSNPAAAMTFEQIPQWDSYTRRQPIFGAPSKLRQGAKMFEALPGASCGRSHRLISATAGALS